MINNLHLVITRPKQQGLQLQQALQSVGISSTCQPLISYQLNINQQQFNQQLNLHQPSLVIFVSVAAVEYAQQAYPLTTWLDKKISVIAVGDATQQALAELGIKSICPQKHDSEGILTLDIVSKVQLNKHPNVIIVRGDGGRELLAQELSTRGAKVEYIESYRKVWLDFPAEQQHIWVNERISGFIITSNALLKRVVEIVNISDNHWKNNCLWVVASARIMASAKRLGLKNVINTHGANDKAIIDTLLNMEPAHD